MPRRAAAGAGEGKGTSIQPVLDAIAKVEDEIKKVTVRSDAERQRQASALNFLKGIHQCLMAFCSPWQGFLGYYFYVFNEK